MRILILIPQFIKYCRIMYDYIFQKDRSVFIPIGIKRIRQYSVQLYCRILRTRQSACFIWYSRYPYDNSRNRKRFFVRNFHIIQKHLFCIYPNRRRSPHPSQNSMPPTVRRNDIRNRSRCVRFFRTQAVACPRERAASVCAPWREISSRSENTACRSRGGPK